MPTPKQNDILYKEFLDHDYTQLESLLFNAETEDERDFYARLCEFYVVRNQKRVMREKPF